MHWKPAATARQQSARQTYRTAAGQYSIRDALAIDQDEILERIAEGGMAIGCPDRSEVTQDMATAFGAMRCAYCALRGWRRFQLLIVIVVIFRKSYFGEIGIICTMYI